MIRSMTGYGMAEDTSARWTVRVETRSVNHGELKVSPRLPAMLRLRESDLNRVVQGKVSRGHVYVTASCELAQDALEQAVDMTALRRYVGLARKVADAEGVPLHIEVGALMSLPDVMSADTLPEGLREEIWAQVVATTDRALDAMVQMRCVEGINMAAQMRQLCADIRRRVGEIGACVDESIRAYRDRLAERVQRLMEESDVRPDRDAIAREVVILAERCDVSEEVARMMSHIQQFEGALDGDATVGKKLEFLVQEMLREANTMAAKLPSSELVQVAVEVKADVHRLREQVSNVE